MKIVWQIEESDIIKVKAFYAQHERNGFVADRFKKNVERSFPDVSHDQFWKVLVSCLLTTQQRSGPNSAITRFICTQPFPLAYSTCEAQTDLQIYAQSRLSGFGGIRRSLTLAEEIQHNWTWLKNAGWRAVDAMINNLKLHQTPEAEIEAASFIDKSFKGFGPKQARNLLQGLGLTRFEIPIDSRITKWLNDFGFPVSLSATALSDENYYLFVSGGFRQLCTACDIYPCMLDAAIFSSYDEEWPADRLV